MRSGEYVDERYRLVDQIGQGGMAEAWIATDVRGDRDVVLKIPRVDVDPAGEEGIEDRRALIGRFQREGDLLRQLQHPGIPTIFGTGTHQGRPYIAMEYIRGVTLHGFREGHWPIPLSAAAAIGFQTAEALAAAHGLHVVHRDLTPHNVMIRDTGRIALIDFGIAMPLRPGATRYTRAGATVGSQGYMAPEQLLEHPPTVQTDVYALGCVLYLLLAGRRPFEETSKRSIPQQHIEDDPLPVTTYIHVPDDLEDLVLQLLAKAPERRPTADAVVAALRPYLPEDGAGDPQPALRPDPTLPFRRPAGAQPQTGKPPTQVGIGSGRRGQPGRAGSAFLSRQEIADRLDEVRRELNSGDPKAAHDQLVALRPVAARSVGRLDDLVSRIELALADSLRIAGDCAAAEPAYRDLADALGKAQRPTEVSVFLILCARLGEAEVGAARGGHDIDGAAVLRDAVAAIADLTADQQHELGNRVRDLALQLLELGVSENEARVALNTLEVLDDRR